MLVEQKIKLYLNVIFFVRFQSTSATAAVQPQFSDDHTYCISPLKPDSQLKKTKSSFRKDLTNQIKNCQTQVSPTAFDSNVTKKNLSEVIESDVKLDVLTADSGNASDGSVAESNAPKEMKHVINKIPSYITENLDKGNRQGRNEKDQAQDKKKIKVADYFKRKKPVLVTPKEEISIKEEPADSSSLKSMLSVQVIKIEPPADEKVSLPKLLQSEVAQPPQARPKSPVSSNEATLNSLSADSNRLSPSSKSKNTNLTADDRSSQSSISNKEEMLELLQKTSMQAIKQELTETRDQLISKINQATSRSNSNGIQSRPTSSAESERPQSRFNTSDDATESIYSQSSKRKRDKSKPKDRSSRRRKYKPRWSSSNSSSSSSDESHRTSRRRLV